MSPIALEILQYLVRHPNAGDTLVGVAHWWILRQRIEAMTIDVKRALDELVELDLVLQSTRPYGEPIYSLNPDKLSQVTLLSGHGPPRSTENNHG